MRVVAISDTHAPRFWKRCPAAVARHLETAELILHAGDVCTPSVLEELSQFAPVHVVLGNNDGEEIAAWGAPVTQELDIDGALVAMIHDSGPRHLRFRRMRGRFPAADLVIFGHSHIPLDQTDAGFRIVNPGSPTDKRRQRHGTVAVIEIADGAVLDVVIAEVS
jgi:putative phosphoesterase